MNAVIYARYSCHSQTEQSIEGQLRDCYAYAERNNLTVISEYIDRAISGTTDDRPSFLRMIDDAPKKQFERILVWKLDRFARNRYDSALYKHKLKQYDVRVISVMENVGEGDESILLEALLEATAEYYSLDLRKKIKRGQRENISKGRFCGGTIPYGYRSVDGKLVADPIKAPIIRYVFEQYAAGTPMRDIIDELTRRGIRSSRGTPLSYNTFSRALVNPAYIGKYRYNGQTVPGLSVALVDEATFERVQANVTRRAHAPAAGTGNVDYLLQGKLFCGMCGCALVGECGRSKTGKIYHYYACANKKKRHTCRKHNERKEALENYVVTRTVRHVLRPDVLPRIARAVLDAQTRDASGDIIPELERTIKRLDRDIAKLVDALISAPKAAHAHIYDKMEQLGKQKEAAEADLARERLRMSSLPTYDDVLAFIRAFTAGTPEDPAFRKSLIETFINSVYVFDDRIVILYNIDDHPSPPRPDTDIPTILASDATPASPSSASDAPSPPSSSNSIAFGSPNPTKSEPKLIFIGTRFGLLLYNHRHYKV